MNPIHPHPSQAGPIATATGTATATATLPRWSQAGWSIPLAFRAVAAAGALASVSCGANMVVNGDFETPWVTATRGWDIYHAGQSFGGWTVGSGSVDVVRIVVPDQGDAWSAASGEQSVDLNGAGLGAIYQDVATIPGSAYYLSFALAGNVVGGPLVVRMEFLWQENVVESLTFDVGNHDGYDVGWTYYQYALSAPLDAATTRLAFESLSDTGPRGPALDDVVLGESPREGIPVKVVPPFGGVIGVPDGASTLFLGFLGLASLAGFRSLQRPGHPGLASAGPQAL